MAHRAETGEMTRCWFRLHLSTALLLSVAAGGLMWANLNERYVVIDGESAMWVSSLERGWPVNGYEHLISRFNLDPQTGGPLLPPLPADVKLTLAQRWGDWRAFFHRGRWRLDGVALDVLTALAILIAIKSVSEWRIARSRAR